MTTKAELVALGDGLKATKDQITVTQMNGMQALSMMSDAEFDTRLRQLKLGRERIAKVQREYMREDEDYGLIPNTPKPTLFKSGAEKLAQLYGLAARVESAFVQGDGEKSPPLTFNAEAYLHIGSFDGPIVAVGHGTANSWEKRYRRDTKLCPNCSQPKIIKSKYDPGWYCLNCKSKYRADDPQITEQTAPTGDVREAYDLGVTLLKMSEKRAFVDAVLRATATSGLFTQDQAEDPPETVDTGFGPSVAQRQAGDASGASTTAAAYSPITGQFTEWPESADVGAEITEPQGRNLMDAILEATGGEEVKVEASNVEGVERGGRTSGANEAQIAEVRRLAQDLGYGSKVLLDYTDSVLGLGIEVPQDGRNARSMLTGILDGMSSERIGTLIQALHKEAEDVADQKSDANLLTDLEERSHQFGHEPVVTP